jgi:iron complex transport system ATP-binding protein
MDTLRTLVGSSGLTVIAVLHDLNLAAQYSDQIILLNEGRIISQGTPEQVLTEVNIETAYNMKVHIMPNPVTGKTHIIPIRGKGMGALAV